MELLLSRIEHGEGRPGDPDLLMAVSGNVGGNSLCALGDAAIGPVRSLIKTFRPEVDRHIAEHGCPFPERRFFAEGA